MATQLGRGFIRATCSLNLRTPLVAFKLKLVSQPVCWLAYPRHNFNERERERERETCGEIIADHHFNRLASWFRVSNLESGGSGNIKEFCQ